MKKVLIFCGLVSLSACGNKGEATSDSDVLFASGFETLDGWLPEQQSATLTHEQAHSGNTSLKVDEAHEYSLTYNNLIGRLRNTPIRKIKVKAWAFLPNPQAYATLVTSIADTSNPSNKPLLWEGISVNSMVKAYGQWTEISKVMNVPSTVTPSNRISIYLWRNSGNQPVYIDDLTVSVEP